MVKAINLKREIVSNIDDAIVRITASLKAEGFGVLTRIDLDSKIKEKIGEDLAPVVILGACNPKLAYEAYQYNSDVASLLPCNAVVRDIGEGRISVELAKASSMMEILGDSKLIALAKHADERLQSALEKM